jgi:hypothetical protein
MEFNTNCFRVWASSFHTLIPAAYLAVTAGTGNNRQELRGDATIMKRAVSDFVLFYRYYSGDKMKRIDRPCSTNGSVKKSAQKVGKNLNRSIFLKIRT